VPLWLWLGAHLIWFFPLEYFSSGRFKCIPRPRTWKNLSDEGQARLLLVLWAGFILLFFSMTFGSRMEYYSFGAWPAIAMLLGIGLAKAEEQGKRLAGAHASGVGGGRRRPRVGAHRHVMDLRKGASEGRYFVTSEEHENDFYRVSMAHMLDLTPQAFALLRLPSALAAGAFLFGLATAWWLRRKRGNEAAQSAWQSPWPCSSLQRILR